MKNLLIAAFIIVMLICSFLTAAFLLVRETPNVPVKEFGVTFSKIQAEALGLDWREVYTSIFEELKIYSVRIPVYWQEVEPEEGQFAFSSIDWMIDSAEKHGAKVILAVGIKLPRWPECHDPHWVRELSIINDQSSNQKLLDYIKKTIERYDDNPAVRAWQIENEPFLNFGECGGYDKYFIDEEIKLVKSLSDKPVVVTDGGEFGDWFRAYKRADIFGSTLYRNVFTELFGHITYPLPPSYFRLRQSLVKLFYGEKPAIVIELQGEPWGPKLIYETPLDEQLKTMNPEKFKDILEYIKGTGFDTFYLWGVEWWYWLKTTQNMPEMWNSVREAVQTIDKID